MTPLLSHFTHRSRLTSLFHHFCWLRGCVTTSLQECFRHVIRYAYPGWSRGSWLGGALVSAQSFVGSVTCLLCWASGLMFHAILPTPLWCVSHHLSSTEMALFKMPVLLCVGFVCCLVCLLFLLLLPVFVLFPGFWHCDCPPALRSLSWCQPCHCSVHGCAVLLLYHGPIVTVNSFHAIGVLIDLAKAKRRWTEKKVEFGSVSHLFLGEHLL